MGLLPVGLENEWTRAPALVGCIVCLPIALFKSVKHEAFLRVSHLTAGDYVDTNIVTNSLSVAAGLIVGLTIRNYPSLVWTRIK
jgi:hypothetical protein